MRREVINNPQLSRSVSLVGGFHIETDEVLEIIMGQVKTYTFAISKEDDESPLENLVIKVDGQGNLNGAIFEYYLTEEEKRNLESKIPINLKQKISWKPLENLEEAAELLLRSDIDCLKFVITGGSICPSGDHDLRQMLNDQCSIVNNGDFTPDPQTIVQIIVDPSCLNEGGPGNGGNTPEGGDGWYGPAWFPLQPGFPGSGDGVGPGDFPDNGDFHQGDYPYNQDEPSQDIWDNTFYTQPVLPQNDKKSPCNQLKELFASNLQNPSSKPDIKPSIEDLMEDAESSINYETGYLFSKTPNNEYINEWVEPNTISQSTLPLQLTGGGNVYGAAHIHTNWLFPMFTWADVYTLYQIHQYAGAHVKKDAVYILVTKKCITCEEVKVYAIKMENHIQLAAKLQSDLQNQNTNGFTIEQQIEYANNKFEKNFTTILILSKCSWKNSAGAEFHYMKLTKI